MEWLDSFGRTCQKRTGMDVQRCQRVWALGSHINIQKRKKNSKYHETTTMGGKWMPTFSRKQGSRRDTTSTSTSTSTPTPTSAASSTPTTSSPRECGKMTRRTHRKSWACDFLGSETDQNNHVPEYHLGHKDSNLECKCRLTGLLIGELTNIVP